MAVRAVIFTQAGGVGVSFDVDVMFILQCFWSPDQYSQVSNRSGRAGGRGVTQVTEVHLALPQMLQVYNKRMFTDKALLNESWRSSRT